MAKEKKEKIEKSPLTPLVNTSEIPTKFLVSNTFLMRKFKISYELSIQVMDVIHQIKSIDNNWVDVKEELSKHLLYP